MVNLLHPANPNYTSNFAEFWKTFNWLKGKAEKSFEQYDLRFVLSTYKLSPDGTRIEINQACLYLLWKNSIEAPKFAQFFVLTDKNSHLIFKTEHKMLSWLNRPIILTGICVLSSSLRHNQPTTSSSIEIVVGKCLRMILMGYSTQQCFRKVSPDIPSTSEQSPPAGELNVWSEFGIQT